jgi:hypothetical protein
MDSELRFYAALWGAYGILLVVVAINIAGHKDLVPCLAAVFFVGGLGRALSYLTVGAPHPFFAALMVVELFLPPVMLLMWWRVRNRLR